MCRISVFLDLSRIHPAGGLGKTSYMYSPFVNAFVEQIFPSGLGLFIHDKASPNTGHTKDPPQKPFTLYYRDESHRT